MFWLEAFLLITPLVLFVLYVIVRYRTSVLWHRIMNWLDEDDPAERNDRYEP